MRGSGVRRIGDGHGHIVRGHCEGIHIAADLPRFIFAVHCQRQEFITRVWRESERNGIVHESGSGIGGFTCFHGKGTIGGIRHIDGICNGRPLRPKFLIAGSVIADLRNGIAAEPAVIVPSGECIAGFGDICCFGQGHLGAVGITDYIFSIDYSTAVGIQGNGVGFWRMGIGGSICCVIVHSRHFRRPSREGIGILGVFGLYWHFSGVRGHCAVIHGRGLQYRTIFIHKCDGVLIDSPLRPILPIAGFLCGNGRYRCACQSFIVKPSKEGVAGLRHVCGQCGSNAIGIAGYIPAVDRAAIRHQCDGISIRRPCAGEFHVIVGHGECVVSIHGHGVAVCLGLSAPPAERVAGQRRRGGNTLTGAVIDRCAGRNSRRAVRDRVGIGIGHGMLIHRPLSIKVNGSIVFSGQVLHALFVCIRHAGIIGRGVRYGVPSGESITAICESIFSQSFFFVIIEALGTGCRGAVVCVEHNGVGICRPRAGKLHVIVGHGECVVSIHGHGVAVCLGLSAPPAECVTGQGRRGGNGLARAISNRGDGWHTWRAVRRRIGISIGNRVRPDTPLCPELQLILIQSCINKQVPLVSVGCSGVIRGWLADGIPTGKIIAFPGKGIFVQRLFFPIFEGLGLICARFKIGVEVNRVFLTIPIGCVFFISRAPGRYGDIGLRRRAVVARPAGKRVCWAGRCSGYGNGGIIFAIYSRKAIRKCTIIGNIICNFICGGNQ